MKLIRKHNELNLLKESNDFDWIRGVDISDYIEKPYFKSMKEYGLSPDEYEIVLSKIFNEPVTIEGNDVYNQNGNEIYYENSDGYWVKREFDSNGNKIYSENSNGYWVKREFDINDNEIYYETSDGVIEDNRNTNLNESGDFDWINDIQVNPFQNIVDNVIVWFDRPITEDESQTLINFIEQAGIDIENNTYATVNTLVRYSQTNGYIRTYVGDYSGKRRVGYGTSKNTLNSMSEYGGPIKYKEYNISDLFGNLPMNESNDFDWIKNIDISDYIEPPYFINMKEYGLPPDEYEIVLSEVFNQPVNIKSDGVYNTIYNTNGNIIYIEDSDGYWSEHEYDDNGNIIYRETSDGYLEKWEYDTNGNPIYYETGDGYWYKKEWDDNGDLIYYENVDRVIRDNRNLNESNDFDWIKNIDIYDYIEPPYFINMGEYGLKQEEYEMVLSKVFNQPVTIKDNWVYNTNGKRIYFEDSTFWYKKEYDDNGNIIYRADSDGDWEKYEYDDNDNEIYYENSDGVIIDNRNLNESNDFDWIKGIDIVDYLEPPYFINMRDNYGLRPDEYEMVLSKIFNQPVTIKGGSVYDTNGNEIYRENSYGFWYKYEYDSNGNEIYYETSNGYWYKYEYDSNGNAIYYENSNGSWEKREYDDQGNIIYYEDSDGYIEDNRNLNESDDLDWIRDIDPNTHMFYQVLNKAFEFDPPAENWDGLELEYNKLVDYLESLGFESGYATPRTIDGDDMAVGLYAYRKIKSGELKYVYTSGIDEDDEESYYQHILEFARDESEDRGKNLQVVDAREFVNNMNQIKEDFDTSNGEKTISLNKKFFLDDYRDEFDWIKDIDISDYLEPPYFKSMEKHGLSPNDYEPTLSKVFGQPITIKDRIIYNDRNKIIYHENSRGDWERYEYDANGNETHYEDVNGHWYKKEYDDQGNKIYYENADGFWVKSEYDNQGNLIYRENSDGVIIDNR